MPDQRPQMRSVDLLITARWTVPVEPAGVVLEDHALVVDGGRIVAEGTKPSDKGSLSFSKDGTRLIFPIAARAAKAEANGKGNGEEATYDLWHWKDDVVQTIQKSRAAVERLLDRALDADSDRPPENQRTGDVQRSS